MMLITLDSPGWKIKDEVFINGNDESFDACYCEDELGKLAKTEKIYYVGLQRKFREDWERNQRELHWGHWNYDGHRLVGSVLAGKIAQIVNPSLK